MIENIGNRHAEADSRLFSSYNSPIDVDDEMQLLTFYTSRAVLASDGLIGPGMVRPCR